ncbi:hypothetical protein [Zhongshania sp.]|jgi:hypothetical protein|uniref:hypothetical protein n=1 Tax=Zhongshania sp. TaxID=1971902 RepID=UPI0039E6BF42
MSKLTTAALMLIAIHGAQLNASSLLDQMMPYQDFYAESSCEQGADTTATTADCPAELGKTVFTNALLGGDGSQAVTMDDIAAALRERLASGLPIATIVDELPPFIRRQLPTLLQSKHCSFENSGEVDIFFDDDSQSSDSGPYSEYSYLNVVCDSDRSFRVVLTDASRGQLMSQAAAMHVKSRLAVELVDDEQRYPAEVSLITDGQLLSEKEFQAQSGLMEIPILFLLHEVNDTSVAPHGAGTLSGVPANTSLIIYETD